MWKKQLTSLIYLSGCLRSIVDPDVLSVSRGALLHCVVCSVLALHGCDCWAAEDAHNNGSQLDDNCSPTAHIWGRIKCTVLFFLLLVQRGVNVALFELVKILHLVRNKILNANTKEKPRILCSLIFMCKMPHIGTVEAVFPNKCVKLKITLFKKCLEMGITMDIRNWCCVFFFFSFRFY